MSKYWSLRLGCRQRSSVLVRRQGNIDCLKESALGTIGADWIVWLGTIQSCRALGTRNEEAETTYVSGASERTIRESLLQPNSETRVDRCINIKNAPYRYSPSGCGNTSYAGLKQIVIKSEMSDVNCSHYDINNLDDDVTWEHKQRMIEAIYRGLYFKPEELDSTSMGASESCVDWSTPAAINIKDAQGHHIVGPDSGNRPSGCDNISDSGLGTNNLDDDITWKHTERMIETIYLGLYFKQQELDSTSMAASA